MSQCEPTPGRRERRGWALRLGAAAVVAGSVLGGAALAAAPAQAASAAVFHPEWVDGCPGCPGPLVTTVDRVYDPQTVATVSSLIGNGLAGLIAASRVTDPGKAQQVHAAAIATFARGAALTGNAAFSPVGDDWDGNICPPGWPWRPHPHSNVDLDVASGLSLLGQAAVSQDPRQAAVLRAQASTVLDAGAAELTKFQGYCSSTG